MMKKMFMWLSNFCIQAKLPSIDECFTEAEKLKRKNNVYECVMYYLLSDSPELGLELGLEHVKSKKCLTACYYLLGVMVWCCLHISSTTNWENSLLIDNWRTLGPIFKIGREVGHD